MLPFDYSASVSVVETKYPIKQTSTRGKNSLVYIRCTVPGVRVAVGCKESHPEAALCRILAYSHELR